MATALRPVCAIAPQPTSLARRADAAKMYSKESPSASAEGIAIAMQISFAISTVGHPWAWGAASIKRLLRHLAKIPWAVVRWAGDSSLVSLRSASNAQGRFAAAPCDAKTAWLVTISMARRFAWSRVAQASLVKMAAFAPTSATASSSVFAKMTNNAGKDAVAYSTSPIKASEPARPLPAPSVPPIQIAPAPTVAKRELASP